MRVLHVVKVTGVAGAERHLLALLPALRARGIDARLLALEVAGSDAARFLDGLGREGVPVRAVPCSLDVDPRLAARVVAAVHAERPDILHTHLVHGDVYGASAGALLRLPFLSTRHNDDRYLLGPFRYVDRAFARRARRLIAISDAVRHFLERAGHRPDRLLTIPYGLDELPSAPSDVTPESAGVSDDVPLVLAVGRLIRQKDHATLLRAFAIVRRNRPAALLAILGSGPLEEETRDLARRLGLDGAVIMPGRVEPRDWLLRADVFAHSSRWEGFGIVLLEAMLSGLPVAATSVSAVPEIVADGRTGLLVAPGDGDALGSAIVELLADPARARALGGAGRERARSQFSVERMTERTLAVYQDL